MTVNMTICPDCGSDMAPIDQYDDPPDGALKMECAECGYDVVIGQLWYPDESFVLAAPAIDEDVCDRCGEKAVNRIQRVGELLRIRCEEHTDVSQQLAVDQREHLQCQ